MAEVERAVIEAALKETRAVTAADVRKAAAEHKIAALIGIGERTLYRKIKEYRLPELEYSVE